MVGLDKALAIATYSGFSIFLILAFSYLFYPSYIDHVESTIATLGSIFLSGGQIYPELTVYSLHGLIYGPGLAEIQAVFQSLGLPVVMASKIPSVLAFAFSSIVLLLFLKNNLARSYLLFLLPFGLFMFWNRAEPFLVLLVALSLIAMAYANGLFAVFLIGIFAGFASSLKLHAALYVVAALIAGGSFTSFGVVGVILFSAGAASAFLLAFFPEQVSIINFLVYLQLSGKHGLDLGELVKNLGYLLIIIAPLFYIGICDFRSGAKFPRVLLVLTAIEGCAAVIGSKPGAGTYHLMPFICQTASNTFH